MKKKEYLGKMITCYDLKNVALYCKGWYAHPEKTRDNWKYLSVAIANDGWPIQTSKKDVVRWIIHRFDENYDWFKVSDNSFGIGWFIDGISKHKMWDSWRRNPEGIDDDDATIILFMSLVSNITGYMFAEKYYPNPRIMPVNLSGPHVEAGKCWEPAELMSEWLERVHKDFPDFKEQTGEPYWTIESFEKMLENKHTAY